MLQKVSSLIQSPVSPKCCFAQTYNFDVFNILQFDKPNIVDIVRLSVPSLTFLSLIRRCLFFNLQRVVWRMLFLYWIVVAA